MSEQPPDLTRQIKDATTAVVKLTAMHGQLIEAARQVQDALIFGFHDDLVRLDDELDNLYPPEARGD